MYILLTFQGEETSRELNNVIMGKLQEKFASIRDEHQRNIVGPSFIATRFPGSHLAPQGSDLQQRILERAQGIIAGLVATLDPQ
jgi:hypothetical protein